MDADKEVPEEKEKDLMSVSTAMTATRHIRRLLQSTGAPIEVLKGLSKEEGHFLAFAITQLKMIISSLYQVT